MDFKIWVYFKYMHIDRKEPKLVENGFKISFPTFSLSFSLDTN